MKILIWLVIYTTGYFAAFYVFKWNLKTWRRKKFDSHLTLGDKRMTILLSLFSWVSFCSAIIATILDYTKLENPDDEWR